MFDCTYSGATSDSSLEHTFDGSFKAAFAFHVSHLYHFKFPGTISLFEMARHLLDVFTSVSSYDWSSIDRLTQDALSLSRSRTVPRTPEFAIVSSNPCRSPAAIARNVNCIRTEPMADQLIRYNPRKKTGDAGDKDQ